MSRKEGFKFRLKAVTGSGIQLGNAILYQGKVREKSEILKSGVCSWVRWQYQVRLLQTKTGQEGFFWREVSVA